MLGKAPNRVETDQVYPLHMLDDTKTLRGIVVTWTLRFDDVLDADKLHDALSRLLDIGDWRKLGGRLRLNVRKQDDTGSFRANSTRRKELSKFTFRDHLLQTDLPWPIHVRG
jgi:hypothetical protein